MEGSSRQIAVLDGSQARLKLVCLNKKLRSARLTTGDTTYDLVATGNIPSGRVSWSLPPNTPFENIRDSLKYEIRDRQRWFVSRKPCCRPDSTEVGSSTPNCRNCRDAARPSFGTADTRLRRHRRLWYCHRHSQHSNFACQRESSKHDLPLKRIEDRDQPQHNLRDQVRIPLSTYELAKGDDVKVSLRVSDWRGPFRPIGGN